jgi:predicted DNA-binding transcriptional regulator AlpA
MSLEQRRARKRNFTELNLTAEQLKVLTLRECAQLNGISWMTLKRLIKAGDGPVIIQLSPKRIGIRVIDNAKWQAARLRSAS